MKLRGTTPVPNAFFDGQMGTLSGSAIRVYLKIARNTFGWRDKFGNIKQRDWIAHSQFEKVGLSNRSVTSAVQELITLELIEVSDANTNPLHDPQRRKKASKVFYAISLTNAKNDHNNIKKENNNAKNSLRPPQKIRTTKEIYLQKLSAKNKVSDQIRIEQIREQEIRKQIQRDSWL